MRQAKVCMLGAFAVGKTSLVARFVEGIFSEIYQTTVGVKIDRKDVAIDGDTLRMILWDLNGEDRFLKVRPTYLRGAAGCLLVVDRSRPQTLDTVIELDAMRREAAGDIPVLVLLNKMDLEGEELLGLEDIAARFPAGVPILGTSAKTGVRVDEAFELLGRRIMGGQ